MTTPKAEQMVDQKSVQHANACSDPELPEWHGRYSSYKQGHTEGYRVGFQRAIDLIHEQSKVVHGLGLEWARFLEERKNG